MKACVFTLGCKQNEAESASIMRGLEELGWETDETLGPADLYLLNTCAVTAEAERKSRQAVARMQKYNPQAPVVVFGCAAEHHAEHFRTRAGVVYVAGTANKDRLPALIGPPREGIGEILRALPADRGEKSAFCEMPCPKQTKTRALLRVQDGCDRFCSYCLIPYLRGRSRSRSLESIVREAEASPAREIVLTGIDLSDWHEGELGLGDLVAALKDAPARIRLGSLEVSAVTDDFLEKACALPNFAPHFHLSLQSGSTRILSAMNRRYTREDYLAACRKIYGVFPGAAITTDIIVGFPGETEEDFQASLSIIGEAGFAKVHAFPFSAREGTAAAKKRGIPASAKKERMDRMLEACKEAERAYLSRNLGTVHTALFEERGGYTENYIRVYHEAAKEGGMYEVRLTKPCQDGAACELIKELI